MTKVDIRIGGKEFSITAEGHATGSNELCAGVSCLLYTLSGWLVNAEDVLIRENRLEEGSARIDWTGGEGSRTAMEFIALGFLQLMKAMPDVIAVRITEETADGALASGKWGIL